MRRVLVFQEWPSVNALGADETYPSRDTGALLIPDRRSSPSGTQPAAPPEVDIYEAEWLRKQKQQSGGEEPGARLPPRKPNPPRSRPTRRLPRLVEPGRPELPATHVRGLHARMTEYVPQGTTLLKSP